MFKKLFCLILVLGMAGAANAALVGHWDMEDGSGTIAADSVGSDDFTLTGATSWVPGTVGSGALSFDDPCNDAAIGRAAGTSLATCVNEITVSLWAYGDGGPSECVEGDCPLVAFGANPVINLRLPTEANGVHWNSGSWTDAVIYYTDNNDIFVNEWHLWTLTRNSTACNIAIYLDLEPAAFAVVGGAPVGGNAASYINIGAYGSAYPYWIGYRGDIDDLRIYDHSMDKGEVLRMQTSPAAAELGKAWEAVPGNGTKRYTEAPTLSWTAGDYAAATGGHKVYFSTDFAEVNDRTIPAEVRNTADYTPTGPLDFDATYYWAVDEVNGATEWPGDVWQFATCDGLVPDPLLKVWLKMDEGTGTTTADSSNNSAHGALVGATASWVAGPAGAIDQAATNNAVSLGMGDYINVTNTSGCKNIGAQVSYAFWENCDAIPVADGTGFLHYDPAGHIFGLGWPWAGTTTQTLMISDAGWQQIMVPTPVDTYVGSWNHWVWIHNADTDTRRVYHNGTVHFESTAMILNDLAGPGTGYLNIGGCWVGSFNGAFDDFRVYNRELPLSAVTRISGNGDPAKAYWPDPAVDVTGIDYTGTTLSWLAGDGAATHDVYLGTDAATLSSSPLSLGQAGLSCPTGGLDLGTKYYWRVDENNGTTTIGDVWSFTVTFGITLEDFESYADEAALQAAWVETWGGSLLETAEVHGGAQAMAFEVENYWGATTVTNSSLSMTDLTVFGIKAMALWVKGDSTNYAQDISVIISEGTNSGSVPCPAGVYQSDDWSQVNVDLTDPAFSSVAMSAVDSLSIMVDPGTSSPPSGDFDTMYVDDIMLYPSRCVAEYGPDCDVTGDCTVDNEDIDVMQGEWLECTTPGGAGCIPKNAIRQVGTMTSPIIDADLSDWGSATWHTIAKPYVGYIVENANDVTEIQYALAWDPANNTKIYAAVKVTDTEQSFMDPNPTSWLVDEGDLLELRIEANGTGADLGAAVWWAEQNIAQMYNFIPKGDGTGFEIWGHSPAMGTNWYCDDPAYDAELTTAYGWDPVDANTYWYEVEMQAFDNYGGFNATTTTYRSLAAGDQIRLDIQIDSTRADGVTWGAIFTYADRTTQNPSDWWAYELAGTVPSVCGDWGYSDTDFNNDCVVDLVDFAELAEDYLTVTLWP